MNVRRPLQSAALAAIATTAVAACGTTNLHTAHASSGQIVAVGAENEYADVMSQIGGRYVAVTAIMSDPNTDPHSFEASPSVANAVASAKLVVQNGVGYDDFMKKIEAADGGNGRTVIDVQSLLGLPDSTPNPHLWYKPATMPAVARALAGALSRMQPSHAAYFRANLTRFLASLKPWTDALAEFARQYPHTPVATTEPVGDYMLEAAGTDNRTPFTLQADIMNGTDPAPQAISAQDKLFTEHKVKVFLYNQQVTDTLTQSFLKLARANHVPVVGVYETMPPGYNYVSWMRAEVKALRTAVTSGKSTTRL